MNDAHAELLQQAKFFFARPDDMRRDHPIVEETDPVQIVDRAGAFRFDAVIDFAFGLRNVRDDGRAGAIGKRADGFQVIF